MKRRARSILLGSSLALGVILTPVALAPAVLPAASAESSVPAPGCEQTWGSLPKSLPTGTSAPVVGVRAGEHPCVDRLVVDIAGAAAGCRCVAGPGSR
jgi:hypothetical protein